MRQKFFVILAIGVLAIFFASGLTGCVEGGSGGDSGDTSGSDDSAGSNSEDNESTDTDSENSGACQDLDPEYLVVNDKYSLKNIQDPWQLDVPNGQTFFYIEKVEPERLSCDGDAFLVKVKLAYRNKWLVHDFEKATGFYVDKSWKVTDGDPVGISGIFPEFDFDHQWAPEPPSGTGSYKTLWAGYSKRPTRATAIADCKSPAYYVDPDNWQWSAVSYFEANSKGEGIIIEVLKKGKVKAISAVGSELVDIDCDSNITIPSDWTKADGNPVDLRYAMSGRWAGYEDNDYYHKSLPPEPPKGTGDFKTLWAAW